MKKFELDQYMVESIEYMRGQEGLSLYGIIHAINAEDSNSELFNGHATKILKYFNDFDERDNDENFIKCFLGHYTAKTITKEGLIQMFGDLGVEIEIGEGNKMPKDGEFYGIIRCSDGTITINLQ